MPRTHKTSPQSLGEHLDQLHQEQRTVIKRALADDTYRVRFGKLHRARISACHDQAHVLITSDIADIWHIRIEDRLSDRTRTIKLIGKQIDKLTDAELENVIRQATLMLLSSLVRAR
jgi:hypothetical protein